MKMNLSKVLKTRITFAIEKAHHRIKQVSRTLS